MLNALKPPDVDCLVVHLQSVHCWWNTLAPPEVNYTFYGRFSNGIFTNECPSYVTENGTRTGCLLPYNSKTDRFSTFYTLLQYGNSSHKQELELKSKVKLNPPINVTVQMGSDSNLWYYWNQTAYNCVENEVRIRTNGKKWDISHISSGRQFYTINMPSPSSMYEMQVRSRLADQCGQSLIWSEWSNPVTWGSNNGTDTTAQVGALNSVWTPVLSVIGLFVLILLAVTLLHYERVRIILLPVVPKPSPVHHDIQDWIQISKSLKESFSQSYNERTCPVQEYHPVSQSDGGSLHSSTSTLSSSDCMDQSGLSSPCSSTSSTSTVLESSEEAEQVSV